MSRLNKYLLAPVLGLVGKAGATSLKAPIKNLPQALHAHSTGNAGIRKLAGNYCPPPTRTHRSRSMGGY